MPSLAFNAQIIITNKCGLPVAAGNFANGIVNFALSNAREEIGELSLRPHFVP